MRLPQLLWPLIFAMLATPVTVAFADEVPRLPVPIEAAMILETGTADAAGYRIVVLPTGKAEAVDGAGHTQGQVSAELAGRFFRNLTVAMPLSKLPSSACTPGLSSTAALFVSWHGEQSPDLSCARDAKMSALADDAKAIARRLYVASYRMRSIPKFITGGQSAPPVPASTPAPPPAPPPPSNPYPRGY